MDSTTHDARYLRYLQRTFGVASVPLFGAVVCAVTLLLIIVLFMVNAAATIVFVDEQPVSVDSRRTPSLVLLGEPIR